MANLKITVSSMEGLLAELDRRAERSIEEIKAQCRRAKDDVALAARALKDLSLEDDAMGLIRSADMAHTLDIVVKADHHSVGGYGFGFEVMSASGRQYLTAPLEDGNYRLFVIAVKRKG